MKPLLRPVAPGSFGLLRNLLVLTILTVAVGCQSVNHLREAQDAFNRSAALENQARYAALQNQAPQQTNVSNLDLLLNCDATEVLSELGAIRSGYAAALASLEKADEAKLRQDQLLGTALTLKALAQWRLGKLDEAWTTADAAAKASTNVAAQLYPRDKAVIVALPDLIKNDLAYQAVLTLKEPEKVLLNATEPEKAAVRERNANIRLKNEQVFLNDIKPRLVEATGSGPKRSAVQYLDAARDAVDWRHPVNVYLIQAQLAAFSNYQRAYSLCYTNEMPETDPALLEARYNLHDLVKLFMQFYGEGRYATSAGRNLVLKWETDYNIVPKPRP